MVAVVVAKTFVELSQFLKRKAHVPRLLVLQFQTVIQRLPTGAPAAEFNPIVRLKVQVPEGIVDPPRVVL